MPPVVPAWNDPLRVASWLQLRIPTEPELALLAECSAAVEPHVQRCRPDQWISAGDPPVLTYTPDNEVMLAAVMLAGRVYRRRNSPAGVEMMGESIAYASRYDPEIDRALRTGHFARPAVG